MNSRTKVRLWIARLCIAVVLAWNLECGVSFLATPQEFAPGFELNGVSGNAAVRGMGLLFIMWNIPYLVALWHPIRHRLSLGEACLMQGVGLSGESWLLTTLPNQQFVLRSSITRFIIFDLAGLLLLILAFWLVGHKVGEIQSR